MKPATLWLYRPLLTWPAVYEWAEQVGISKMLPPEQLHLTLATVRRPIDWGNLELRTDTLVIPEGCKVMQIFGYMAKGLALGHPDIKARHEELAALYPQMDHPRLLRPHVTLYRGGKMIHENYEGPLIFGPEVAEEFDEQKVRTIKHLKVRDVMTQVKEQL